MPFQKLNTGWRNKAFIYLMSNPASPTATFVIASLVWFDLRQGLTLKPSLALNSSSPPHDSPSQVLGF